MKKLSHKLFKTALCQYCLVWFGRKEMVYDHFIPKSKGGTDDESNLVQSCFYCNGKKGAKIFASIKEVREFIKAYSLGKAYATVMYLGTGPRGCFKMTCDHKIGKREGNHVICLVCGEKYFLPFDYEDDTNPRKPGSEGDDFEIER